MIFLCNNILSNIAKSHPYKRIHDRFDMIIATFEMILQHDFFCQTYLKHTLGSDMAYR